MNEYAISEIMRMLERMVVVSTVTEFDANTAKAKVKFGEDAESDWLPIVQLGSKDVRIWLPPVVGSQVIVLSPGGDTTKGMIMPGPYDGAAPDDSASSFRISMPGVDLRMADGEMTLDLTTANITGDLIVDGDVVASGISLVNHVHGGVFAGSADTESPK